MGARLEGRRIVVTGAASGIGAAVARLAAVEGARVACLDRDGAGVAALAASLPLSGYSAQVDVTDPDAVKRAINAAAKSLGAIDGLVNSAGIVALGPVDEMTIDTWRKVIDVNLTGTFIVSQATIPHMRTTLDAAIVNIASAQALMPIAGASAYAASKGGVQSLSKALAAELAPAIRVNCICPGLIDTPMNAGLKKAPEDGPPVPLDRYALRRWGKPEEIAASIVYLLSKDASYVTGATLAIDGGRTFH
ncbi:MULTISPECIES: SDR family NAD(P)-dependent oxidoreductase [unclassified Chelatococcus]|uniref:SDR family NAD(P)-dependent oxidoreductase n=1 Tax=unclassified Chelatococcus TaxID=2638111 RepID=UPI001BCE622B|nr:MULTISPECIES: SDR family NAD(P)-dependent oxidoreductase [unclassified Chelatococcus]CAH1652385.1 2-(S)-hydroxypropyl-CoM dehydrogenase [Hyphomicrobiales bacterium]MBS7743040.1 SDR family oxidoreductase [Chelatococcus sp. HY11]MBX3541842.1 SDR family oxidoreductase [Chelatococcus sp.]MCO5074267.1 SDR family oxidoreductase [Chelatococcus sp.]CAH1693818.1 2-(S)-hydroxypropyl-CoM dehydrogenase [Hyphomicrobiales bacterium]